MVSDECSNDANKGQAVVGMTVGNMERLGLTMMQDANTASPSGRKDNSEDLDNESEVLDKNENNVSNENAVKDKDGREDRKALTWEDVSSLTEVILFFPFVSVASDDSDDNDNNDGQAPQTVKEAVPCAAPSSTTDSLPLSVTAASAESHHLCMKAILRVCG